MNLNLLEIALIVSIVVAVYNLQQIKMILKSKGHAVDLFTGWITDYRLFKEMAHSDKTDEQERMRYQKILNGLHFSLIGLVFIGFMMFSQKP
jgi:hypothetical protein